VSCCAKRGSVVQTCKSNSQPFKEWYALVRVAWIGAWLGTDFSNQALFPQLGPRFSEKSGLSQRKIQNIFKVADARAAISGA
jgi:hypothetical protein